MAQSQNLEYLNFNCKFGNDLNLLDLAEEVVLPAFFDRSLRRVYEETTYFIHRPQLVSIGADETGIPIVGVAGRFVKNTIITRGQVFDAELDEIVQREIRLRNAPSAFFVLILNDHRLLYVKETGDAPIPKTFGTTMRRFIRIKYEEFIRSLKAEDDATASEEERKAISLKALREQYPKPEVDLIPLMNTDLTPNFMSKFQILEKLTFHIITTNEEDTDPFFEELARRKKAVNASEGDLTYENKEEGLSIPDAESQIEEAARVASGASIKVEFRGQDASGQRVTGDNDDIKVSVPFDFDTRGVESNVTIAKRMLDRFRDSIDRGIVQPATSRADPAVLRDRLQRLQRQAPDWNAQGASRPTNSQS